MGRQHYSLSTISELGPNPVGVVSLDLPDPETPGRRLPTDIWYPANPNGFDAYEVAPHPLVQPHAARTDARPEAGPFPLVAFSHGNSGLRRQSTFLTTHLASWGIVVVAPDHTGNTFIEMALIKDEDSRIRVHKEARLYRPRDLQTAIAALTDPAPLDAARLPAVDASLLGVLGHSFGGWTALKQPALDARVRAVCGLAPASEPFIGKKAFGEGELPFESPLPTLLVSGVADVLVDLDSSVRPLFARLREPCALVGVEGADHFHFCDGLPLLHGMHEAAKRPKQTRPTQPYAELLPEAQVQRLLRGLVTSFFLATLCEDGAMPDLSLQALAELDPALCRLDAGANAS